MPSMPSLARTVRNGAGTETRPLVSIRLVKVDTNWSISPSWCPGRTGDDCAEAPISAREKWVGEAALLPPWPQRSAAWPLPPLTERAIMGYHGILRESKEFRGEIVNACGKHPRR